MIGRRSRISVAVGVGLVMVLSAAPGLVQAPGVPTVVVANADTGTMEAIPVPPGASIHFHSNGSSEDLYDAMATGVHGILRWSDYTDATWRALLPWLWRRPP